jgi:hypothetical protein
VWPAPTLMSMLGLPKEKLMRNEFLVPC